MRFDDLKPWHVRAMIRIGGWASDGPSIGALEESLSIELRDAVMELEQLGLARVEPGWHGSRWWHLTDRGRAVQERGEG